MTREDAIDVVNSLINGFAESMPENAHLLSYVRDYLEEQPASPGWQEFRTYLFKKMQEEIDECTEFDQAEYEGCLRVARSFIATIPPPQPKDCDPSKEVQQGGCEGINEMKVIGYRIVNEIVDKVYAGHAISDSFESNLLGRIVTTTTEEANHG